jgi:hypothetical protein
MAGPMDAKATVILTEQKAFGTKLVPFIELYGRGGD